MDTDDENVTPLRPEAMRETVRQGHVKLISDGTRQGTFLLMPDGTPIPGISYIEWVCDASDGARARLTVEFIKHEVEIGTAG